MSILAELSISKPSKALNVVYVIFGYVIASMFVPSKFDILGQVAITTAIGGLLATFFFYIKPVERILFMVFAILKKWETSHGASWFHEENVPHMNIPDITNSMSLLREVFNCPMIANEKMGITGAIFFSISVLISGKALDQIGVSLPSVILICLSIPTIAIALWDSYYLWNKMHVLTMFYNFIHQGELGSQFMTDLRKAIESKDWLEARLTISSRRRLGATFGKGGLCTKCKAVKSVGDHCDVCGRRLLSSCPNCLTFLAGTLQFPKFCPYCGKAIPA